MTGENDSGPSTKLSSFLVSAAFSATRRSTSLFEAIKSFASLAISASNLARWNNALVPAAKIKIVATTPIAIGHRFFRGLLAAKA